MRACNVWAVDDAPFSARFLRKRAKGASRVRDASTFLGYEVTSFSQ